MARRRYQKGQTLFSKSRQLWLGRYREDTIRPDGSVIRARPQIVLGTKKELPTQRLAARKLDEILSRINDCAYQPTRIATMAEFAARWREEVLAKRKPSAVRSANSHLDSHILPQLGKLRLDQVGPENQQVFVNQLAGASRKTVLNVLSTLSSMLATAKNWGYSSGEIAGMANRKSKPQVVPSSGNVFADLGLPNAEDKQTKVRLAVAINQIVQSQQLSQAAAARRLHVNQPKVSALSNYQLEGFSVERLINFLTALDRDVDIVIRRKPQSRKAGRVLVTAA